MRTCNIGGAVEIEVVCACNVTEGIRKVLDFNKTGLVGRDRPHVGLRERGEKDVSKVEWLREDVSDRPKWRCVVRSFHH